MEKSLVLQTGWELYTFYISFPSPFISWILLALTLGVISVAGYAYFKVVFSNYWSSAVFAFFLFFIDLEMLAILLGSFLFLSLADLFFSVIKNMAYVAARSEGHPLSSTRQHFYNDDSFYKPRSNFSRDLIKGHAMGVIHRKNIHIGAKLYHSSRD